MARIPGETPFTVRLLQADGTWSQFTSQAGDVWTLSDGVLRIERTTDSRLYPPHAWFDLRYSTA